MYRAKHILSKSFSCLPFRSETGVTSPPRATGVYSTEHQDGPALCWCCIVLPITAVSSALKQSQVALVWIYSMLDFAECTWKHGNHGNRGKSEKALWWIYVQYIQAQTHTDSQTFVPAICISSFVSLNCKLRITMDWILSRYLVLDPGYQTRKMFLEWVCRCCCLWITCCHAPTCEGLWIMCIICTNVKRSNCFNFSNKVLKEFWRAMMESIIFPRDRF